MPEREVGDNPLMGQDPKTAMKAKNQDQFKSRREEYLRVLRNVEVFKNDTVFRTHMGSLEI